MREAPPSRPATLPGEDPVALRGAACMLRRSKHGPGGRSGWLFRPPIRRTNKQNDLPKQDRIARDAAQGQLIFP